MISVKTIVDDNLAAPLRAEHGLALWVSVENGFSGLKNDYLFDTGQHADVLSANAAAAGVDLSAASAVVLSHGHYDHTGGLPALECVSPLCPVFLGPDAERRRFSTQVGVAPSGRKMLKPIGMPRPDELASHTVRRVSGVLRQSSSLTLFTLPQAAPPNVRLIAADAVSPDSFSDEVFALVSDGVSNMLFGGCTHHGLPLLLDFVFGSLGVGRVDWFVGGLHLQGRPADEIEAVADVAARYPVRAYAPLHCTGADALAIWRRRFHVVDGPDFVV